MFAFHTAYKVSVAFVVYVPPALHVAVVAVELVDQPLNVYPVLVGLVLDRVSDSSYHLVWLLGAPDPPLALYETVYDGFALIVILLLAVIVLPDSMSMSLKLAQKLIVR